MIERQDVTTREVILSDNEFRKLTPGAFRQAMLRGDGLWIVDLLRRAPEPAPPVARHIPLPPAPALPKRGEPAPEPKRRIPAEAFRC